MAPHAAGQLARAHAAAQLGTPSLLHAPRLSARQRALRCLRAGAAAAPRASVGGTNTEIRICTNKCVSPRVRLNPRVCVDARCGAQLTRTLSCVRRTCRHEGSMNIADAARELAPPGVTVERTGCLGKCGTGPNLMLLPSGLTISYCSTPAQLAQLLERQCVNGQGTHTVLQALEVRRSALRLVGRLRWRSANSRASTSAAAAAHNAAANPRGAHPTDALARGRFERVCVTRCAALNAGTPRRDTHPRSCA
jgi:hypothetical protein